MLNYKKDVYPYILDSIDFSDYDINPESEKDKLQEVFNQFKRTAIYDNNLRRFKYNLTDIFADYLMGLPSFLNLAFTNYEILQLAKSWKSIPEDATEKQEDKIISNYYNFMAVNFFKLFRKYKINMD